MAIQHIARCALCKRPRYEPHIVFDKELLDYVCKDKFSCNQEQKKKPPVKSERKIYRRRRSEMP